MNTIKYKSEVSLHYSLKAEGVLFESTFNNDPIKISIGECNLPQILESALYGLKVGDKKCFSFSSRNIFGDYDQKKIKSMPLSAFKNYKDIKTGDIIETVEDNESYYITIIEKKDKSILVDINHPLCNKDIIFEVEILNIKNAT